MKRRGWALAIFLGMLGVLSALPDFVTHWTVGERLSAEPSKITLLPDDSVYASSYFGGCFDEMIICGMDFHALDAEGNIL